MTSTATSAPLTIERTWAEFEARVPFRLGVVSSELGQDFERVCGVTASLSIRDLELHSLWGKEAVELTEDEAQRAREIVRSHGLRVCTISGPAFKALTLDAIAAEGEGETSAYAQHRRTLEREIELAHFFGTDSVRVFGFRRSRQGIEAGTPGWRPSGALTSEELETVRRGFAPLVGLAEREGVTLMLENVRYCYADTGAHTRQLLDAVNSPRLRVIWDPGNAFVAGEARVFPDGYAAVREATAEVHCKDGVFTDPATGQTEWRRIGNGDCDWAGQLRALIDDRFSGVIALETHWKHPAGGADVRERSTIETWHGLAAELERALRA